MAYPEPELFADPAAGAAFETTVPGGVEWKIWSGGYRFVTSATVANRTPRLKFTKPDTNADFYGASLPVNITASSDYRVVFYDQHGYHATSFFSAYYPIGIRSIWLPAGTEIAMPISGIQSGDQVSDIVLLVEERSV